MCVCLCVLIICGKTADPASSSLPATIGLKSGESSPSSSSSSTSSICCSVSCWQACCAKLAKLTSTAGIWRAHLWLLSSRLLLPLQILLLLLFAVVFVAASYASVCGAQKGVNCSAFSYRVETHFAPRSSKSRSAGASCQQLTSGKLAVVVVVALVGVAVAVALAVAVTVAVTVAVVVVDAAAARATTSAATQKLARSHASSQLAS